MYFGTPDEGYFMSTAPTSSGPWEPLQSILAEPGWDDCCTLWTADERGYLVGTRFADQYKTYIARYRPLNPRLSSPVLADGAAFKFWSGHVRPLRAKASD